ncbi:hypothetical protein BS628_03105 [Agrobacterium radiobacter]|nr:hypothetical protein ASH09_04525 [Agrobacterium radiobacter]OOO39006.1 hypothetical protein BS628_03105 [Agrobacterium radiobacter]
MLSTSSLRQPCAFGLATLPSAPLWLRGPFIPVADTPGLRGLTSCTTRSTTARAGGGNQSPEETFMTITTTLISITSVALVGSILIFLVAMLVSVDRNV